MKTLIIVPHLDDEVLSCGGLIMDRRYFEHDVNVWVGFGRKYPGVPARELAAIADQQYAQARLAMKVMTGEDWNPFGGPLLEEGEPGTVGYYALLVPLERQLAQWQPDEVVIPGRDDLNQDHRFLNEVCRIALRPGNRGSVKRVLEFTGLDVMQPVDATYGLEMTEGRVDRLIDAMACYEQESRKGAHPRSPENIKAQRRFYGSRFGVQFAEPYRLVLEVEGAGNHR